MLGIQSLLCVVLVCTIGLLVALPYTNTSVVSEDEIDWSLCFGGYTEYADAEPEVSESDTKIKTFSTLSVVEKVISSPNIPAAEWRFLYNSKAIKADLSDIPDDNSAGVQYTWTTIVEPDKTEKT
ncbi:hypothetical protein [Catenovulum sediminis]|uniref:Uncharacterized protein n=1 Tax=Catenovulum sediminis TaxID=1740262 RepID=A0ABV1RMG3_9ALTE